MDKVTLTLTVGERLLLHRRRLGLSQLAFARMHDVSRTRYGRMERDDEPCVVPIPKSEDVIPNSSEVYLILRRREGLRHKDIANELNMSRFWINQMELGFVSDEPLKKFWENRL